jgi:hypothetical protein
MVDDGKRLTREEGSVRPAQRTGRVVRGNDDEFSDLGRGTGYVGTESVAVAMDILSRVLRGAVDNLLDEDYSEPGDVLRGITNEADLAAYDLVDELRKAPRRLDKRFDEGIRSPRADRGERSRRSDD